VYELTSKDPCQIDLDMLKLRKIIRIMHSIPTNVHLIEQFVIFKPEK